MQTGTSSFGERIPHLDEGFHPKKNNQKKCVSYTYLLRRELPNPKYMLSFHNISTPQDTHTTQKHTIAPSFSHSHTLYFPVHSHSCTSPPTQAPKMPFIMLSVCFYFTEAQRHTCVKWNLLGLQVFHCYLGCQFLNYLFWGFNVVDIGKPLGDPTPS